MYSDNKEVIKKHKKRRQLDNTATMIMKNSTVVLSNITNKSSKNFENKVMKLLPEGVSEIYLSSCGMKRLGTGSYNYFLDIKINDTEYMTLKSHTNSSPSWDDWSDTEAGTRKHDNFNKSVALMLLEDCRDEIIEFLTEENE